MNSKKSIIIIGVVILIGIIGWLSYQKNTTVSEISNSVTSRPSITSGDDVFIPAIDQEHFNNLKPEDLPSTLPDGYASSAAAHKDSVFVASINHILEYNQNGDLVRYSDPKTFNCSEDLPSVITIAEDTLYAACWNVGIFEIDLLKNRMVYFFDANNGLTNLQNLFPVIDGNSLWVATVNGLFKIDRTSRIVKTYPKIFGTVCPDDNIRVFSFKNDVWATSLAGCGAAEYHPTDDSWTIYNPDAFNQIDLSRVDFDEFIVSDAGVFATHQDGGPDHNVLNRFDSTTKEWKRVMEKTWNLFIEFLPSPDEYRDSFASTFDGVTTWGVKTANDWLALTLPDRRYLAMTSLVDDRYFLLSSLGIEQLVQGQAFPELLATQIAGNTGARILVSSKGNFVLGISDQVSERGEYWVQSIVTVYNRQTKQAFTSIIPGEGDRELPLAGFLKDPSAFSFIEQDSTLLVTENEKKLLLIDPNKKQLDFF